MKYFIIVITIFNILLLFNTLYFGVLALFPFLMKKKKRDIISTKKHSFLVLIAARNEELVLGNLIDSINKQNYDKNLFKICVIPNNCTDNTKQIALDKKCMVIEPKYEIKSKGEVLNYAFNYFRKDKSFDTYVIFDADNILDKNFLTKMNDKLNEGYNIVQGFRDTKNLYENIITDNYALFFYLESLSIYTARDRIGESSTINGTGYIVTKQFIDKVKYKAYTLTEDVELTCICALNKEIIGYAKDAIFYDEQVSDFKTSMIQRRRWIQGCNQVFRKYSKNLLSNLFNKFNFQMFDMFQFLYLPFNQPIAFVFLILSYIFILDFKIILFGLLIGYIGQVLYAFFVFNYYHKKISKLVLASFFFPIFNLTWLLLYIYAFFNTNNNWEEIKHNKDYKIEDLVDK